MGAVISAIIAGGLAAAAAIASAAVAAGTAIASAAAAIWAAILAAAEGLGLIAITQVIFDASLAGAEIFELAPLLGGSTGVFYAGTAGTEIALTAAGAYAVGFGATSLLVGGSAGLVLALASTSAAAGRPPAPEVNPNYSLLTGLKLCPDGKFKMQCRNYAQSKVRGGRRQTRKRTMLSDGEESWDLRETGDVLYSNGQASGSRKVSRTSKRLRRTRRK